jgi:hypothetical protein
MMNKLPDLVKINIFTTKRICNSADMKALLDILEFFPEFTPQKWGKDGKPKQAYARDEMVTDFLTPDGGNLFFRNQKPKYEGSFPTSTSGKIEHFDLDIQPETKEHVRQVFELGNLLAEFFEPIYGSVHPIWESNKLEYKKYSIPGITPLIYFTDGGPRGIAARNWFGPIVVKKLGRAVLEESGGVISWMKYGGICLDITSDLVNSDIETLIKSQDKILNNLEPTNIFGNYSNKLNIKPGSAWSNFFN